MNPEPAYSTQKASNSNGASATNSIPNNSKIILIYRKFANIINNMTTSKKVNKSWAVTLLFTILVAVLPIIDGPLQENFGITISEEDLRHFLIAFGLTAGAGVANAARKQIKKPQVQQVQQVPIQVTTAAETVNLTEVRQQPRPQSTPAKPHDIDGVQFNPPGAWVQTNFVKDPEKGNSLPFGKIYLWIKIPKARSYITVQLKDSEGKLIQIDQSSESDEDNDHTTVRLEMFSRNGEPLPKGKYTLKLLSDSGTSYSQGVNRDEFWIV